MNEMQDYNEEELEEIAPAINTQTKTLLIGAAVGALTGLAAAFLFSRRAVKNESDVTITPTEGLKIGLLVVGLLRSVATLGGDEK
jgi:ABC-type uncharacterized transport system permease subunit